MTKSLLALTAFGVLLTGRADATQVTFRITGRVTMVDDHAATLDGSIAPGTTFTGSYSCDTASIDENVDPTVGDYWSRSVPSGVHISMGSYVFETNPAQVQFLVEVVNRTTDTYLFRSYQNRASDPRPRRADHRLAARRSDGRGPRRRHPAGRSSSA